MQRIFTRDVAGCRAGQIEDLDWSAWQASAAQHHGVRDPLDAYSLPVEEAARRYVASLHAAREPTRPTADPRRAAPR